jgi:hypothetical protein
MKEFMSIMAHVKKHSFRFTTGHMVATSCTFTEKRRLMYDAETNVAFELL